MRPPARWTFEVTLSAASGQTVTVDYATSDNTAVDPDDYTEITTTQVSFAAGDTSEDVVVTIANDTVFENSESFFIDLSNPANATIADNQGEGTILDDGTGTGGTDNDTPTVSVDDVTATEGTDSHAVFTVSLSNASAEANIFSLALADDTATGAGTDYGTAGADNIQVFVSGSWDQCDQCHHSGWLYVPSKFEPRSPTMLLMNRVRPSDLTATLTTGTTTNASATGTGTIADDDGAPQIMVNDVYRQ